MTFSSVLNLVDTFYSSIFWLCGLITTLIWTRGISHMDHMVSNDMFIVGL